MFRLILAAIVGGGFLAYLGFNQVNLANKVESEPTACTLAELASGEVINAHVLVSDFYPTGGWVYEENKSGDYAKIWAAVFGNDHPAMVELDAAVEADDMEEVERLLGTLESRISGRDLKVLIKSTECRTEGQVEDLLNRETLRGVVINDMEGLDGDTARLLREAYPGMDVDEVLILEADRDPPTMLGAIGMMLGGVGLAGGGAATGVIGRKRADA